LSTGRVVLVALNHAYMHSMRNQNIDRCAADNKGISVPEVTLIHVWYW